MTEPEPSPSFRTGHNGPMKRLIGRIPILGNLARRGYRRLVGQQVPQPAAEPEGFVSSGEYWEERYALGGNSGTGSYSKLAAFKAEILNGFVKEHAVGSVIEFGCGDGNQLSLARYPRYFGLDVSATIVAKCRERFASDPTRTFALTTDYRAEVADLALSLDVIYHLVEDEVFDAYMRRLFGSASRYVIVYSSDSDDDAYQGGYIRHRKFTSWAARNAPEWRLFAHIPNRFPYTGDDRQSSLADFYVYEKG